ncbi:MAG: 6-phosphogluconolactonase [Cyclobacteriaceae bacterium]|nr:6-phosphogluconolactonase [Cyclobacteriaceae bacterium]
MEVKIHDNQLSLAEAFCQWLLVVVDEKVGKFHLALSGGSTPAVIYRLLGEKYTNKIDWEKVCFYWSDERCVPPEHSDSNFKMANELFLSSILNANIYRISGENHPVEEAQRYSSLLERNIKDVAFDLIMLGLGDDGHTASIFPGQRKLWDDTNACVAVQNPYTGQFRISFTGKIINNARNVAVICSGTNKAEKIKEIFERKESAEHLPGAWIKPLQGTLYWYLDKEAAQLIPG